LKSDKKIEDLYSQVKRWTYAGRPTKKARKIHTLQQIINAYDKIWQITDII